MLGVYQAHLDASLAKGKIEISNRSSLLAEIDAISKSIFSAFKVITKPVSQTRKKTSRKNFEGGEIKDLSKQAASLQRQLIKEGNPEARAPLINQIEELQSCINASMTSREAIVKINWWDRLMEECKAGNSDGYWKLVEQIKSQI